MASICRGSLSPNACSHHIVTVDVDGALVEIHTTREEIESVTLDEFELRRFLLWQMKRLLAVNPEVVNLAELLNRTIIGEEGTNLRIHTLFEKDITKTNIGTSYVNIPVGLNGERKFIDFTGFTQFRVLCNFNLVGSGAHRFRVVDQQNLAAVLWESPEVTGTGEKEINSADDPAAVNGWLPIPVGLITNPSRWVIVQAKSTTGSDDPVYRRCDLGLR